MCCPTLLLPPDPVHRQTRHPARVLGKHRTDAALGAVARAHWWRRGARAAHRRDPLVRRGAPLQDLDAGVAPADLGARPRRDRVRAPRRRAARPGAGRARAAAVAQRRPPGERRGARTPPGHRRGARSRRPRGVPRQDRCGRVLCAAGRGLRRGRPRARAACRGARAPARPPPPAATSRPLSTALWAPRGAWAQGCIVNGCPPAYGARDETCPVSTGGGAGGG